MLLASFLGFTLLLSHGCVLLLGAAAGGAGAYILRDQGYKVQSPVEDVQPPIKKE
jgi:hypothetical protein